MRSLLDDWGVWEQGERRIFEGVRNVHSLFRASFLTFFLRFFF